MKRLQQEGFTLVEMAIVVLLIGMVLAFVMPTINTTRDTASRTATTAKLQAIQTALINFAAQNQRLPCPADGTIPEGAANAGVEARNANGDCLNNFGGAAIGEVNGVVPWVTLGLSTSDGKDDWNNRITYRVPFGSAGFTYTAALNMTGCDAAGTLARVPGGANTADSCQVGCSAATTYSSCTSPANFILSRGLQVSDGAGNCLMDPFANTGAAYVLISHGSNKAGAFNTSGSVIPAAGATPASSPLETTNANGLPLKAALAGCAGAYNNATFAEATAGAVLHFDDLVVAQSLMSLINAAQLGPRTH